MFNNISEIYNKIRRNVNNEYVLAIFFLKIKHKINLFMWEKFPQITNNRIIKFSNNEISNEKFRTRFDEIFNNINISSIEYLTEPEKYKILELANKHLSDYYELLGSQPTLLNPINWHVDFKSGYVWKPQLFYKRYVQESIDSNSDVKVPRELSRCHHLLNLSLAYRITNDKKYAKKVTHQICNWIDENPLMYSINWGCTMDVAIRATNWIYALNLIQDYWNEDISLTLKIKNSLYQHGWFIFRNLEKEINNNHNHYLADIAGQIHLGLLFKDTKEGTKWLNEGIKELFKEIRYQILPSGMSYERSTNYNRLVLELLLTPILVLKNNNFEIPQDIWFRLEKMFEFIGYSLKPDGHTPVIGDQDNGRLLPFGVEDQTDYTYLLSLGAILFKRGDWKYLSGGFNIYCLMFGGKNSFEDFSNIQAQEIEFLSKGFPDIGLFTMRKDNNYLIFNCTGKGMNPDINKFSGTHTHSDHLSFELVSKGKTFLVDPGSFVYTANADERFKFRSTFMHNTVCIDNVSQDNVKKEMLWDFERNAIPRALCWETNTIFDKIIACHNGYERLTNPVTHFREITFFKTNATWEISDYFEGVGNHIYDWYFHFDIGIDFIIENNTITTICDDGNNIRIFVNTLQSIKLSKINSFVSKAYGKKEPSYSLKIKYEGEIQPRMNITILSI
jgi:hypothetical protein